jgi:prepilin-type N-terminal cleavage/methylation domain-containing protein
VTAMKHHPKAQNERGFSLIEIIFAMSIMLIVVAGVLPMYVQSSKSILTADSKLDVNRSMRKVTDQLIQYARQADAFVLYDNFKGAWIDGDFVNFRNPSYIGQGRLRDGETGRFLVLIYFDVDPYPDDANPAPIKKLVGFYLDAEESNDEGALRYFEKTTIDHGKSMEENLPSATTMGSNPILVDSITGLMSGDIFFNFGGRSVMLNGKITHANGAMNETNTYNFTITPR